LTIVKSSKSCHLNQLGILEISTRNLARSSSGFLSLTILDLTFLCLNDLLANPS